jgi:hypothetical protein
METLKVQRSRLRNAGLSNYIRNEFRLEAAAARTSAGLSQMEVAEVADTQVRPISSANARHHPPQTPQSFYNQGGAASLESRKHTISALPVVASRTPDPFETSMPPPTTRSQANISKTPSGQSLGDNCVVIIDSDDDGPDLQSPNNYTSPKTNSEKKTMLERSIPTNVIQSLKKFGKKEWRFAYPVFHRLH